MNQTDQSGVYHIQLIIMGLALLLIACPVWAIGSKTSAVVARARLEVTRGVHYDGSYRVLSFKDESNTGKAVYPGGDIDPNWGVCTDVVIRALRAVGIDLQRLVHEDIVSARAAYRGWVKQPDVNIDHRRVGPLMVYLKRHAKVLSVKTNSAEAVQSWQPGDLVIWSFSKEPGGTPNHIGLISDRQGPRGLPLVIHNLGPVPTEDDTLDAWTIIGHYRLAL